MGVYLGIDGGGSKTDCAVGNNSGVLGRASTGASNPLRVGESAARSVLHEAVLQACNAARVLVSEVQGTCVGLAGAARPEVAETMRRLLAELVPGRIEVVGDMIIALEAAFAGSPGVVVIAGTGSIAYGRNERGETARAGGWGPQLSDEGSGDWIGREAVRAVLRAHDEGRSTALTAAVMEYWRLKSHEALVHAVNTLPPPDFPGLFPQVLAAAQQRDVAACELLARAGRELAGLALMVMARLWERSEPVRVCISGGVFQNAPAIQQAFTECLAAERGKAQVRLQGVDPVQGALHLARRAAGEPSLAGTARSRRRK